MHMYALLALYHHDPEVQLGGWPKFHSDKLQVLFLYVCEPII